MNTLALRWRLKLLGIETPGKDAGQGLEELAQQGNVKVPAVTLGPLGLVDQVGAATDVDYGF